MGEKVLMKENEQTEVEDKKMQRKSKKKKQRQMKSIVSFELQQSLSRNT